MGSALFWGAVAGSSLLIGGAITYVFRIGTRPLGLVMAFGAGVLISAVSYELVADAFATAERGRAVAFGLFAGAAVFFAGDAFLDRMGAANRKRSSGTQAGGSALAIVLGIVLDGIPESIVLGLTILEGGGVSAAVLAAIFISNLPESIAASTGLSASGWPRSKITLLWIVVGIVTALSSLAGYVLFDEASEDVVAFVLAFAAGAILTMLADTMMPEAFEHGGKLVGLFTTLGFALAFGISAMESGS
jgi:zinc transporter, ZIP family